MTDFTDITYLERGSEAQKRAYKILTAHKIPELLEHYTPLLAGTMPIDIAVEQSDLDILCFWEDRKAFTDCLEKQFGRYPEFRVRNTIKAGKDTVIANFTADGFPVEIFGQNTPVTKQEAYIHMIAEDALLREKGEEFREHIRRLKSEGIKTEPAFGILLEMTGDPYRALLDYGRKILKANKKHKTTENGL
ncbi:DUF4269 domain-containing protein [Sinomicrobium sp. M5D2P9]